MPQKKNKTAFVTGGTGFVGLNLVEQLCAAGWEVTAAHRPTSDTSRLAKFPVTLAKAGLLEPEALTEAMPERVDAVFHVAGNTSVWSRNDGQQMLDNINGTRNVLAAAEKRKARRFVHTSTWNVYGYDRGEALTEDSDKRGEASAINYDRTKYYAELCVLVANEDGIPCVILNPAHVMGRYDSHNWSRMITLIDRGKLPGVPPGTGTFAHAEAVAKAHIAAAEKGRPGENYLLGGPEASYVEVARIIGEILGKKVPKKPIPAPLLKLAGRVQAGIAGLTGKVPQVTPEAAAIVCRHGRIASTKAEKELGYKCPDLRTQILDAIGWMRTEGLIEN